MISFPPQFLPVEVFLGSLWYNMAQSLHVVERQTRNGSGRLIWKAQRMQRSQTNNVVATTSTATSAGAGDSAAATNAAAAPAAVIGATAGNHFIHQIIDADRTAGRLQGRVVTRFPPEPNGYLHLGHAKSICLNFGIAEDYQGRCALRFDDTNPARECSDYIAAIKHDLRWLGFDWGTNLHHASDYFERLYAYAEQLIESGNAYVCELDADRISRTRGTLKSPGVNSPYRDRAAQQSLALFRRMRNGEFADGAMVLRARIDMVSANMNLRDPVIYRILRALHPITARQWCIYPLYDFAHALSDAIEGVTHSLCTLEFEDHRPLYDWFLSTLNIASPPRQYEFSRLNLSYTVMSKRILTGLVDNKHVEGWDDPRLPTLAGLRRRGYTAAAVRAFCSSIGVTRSNSTVELAQLENCLRQDLEASAPRVMGVIHPLRLIIENYPEDTVEWLHAPNHPRDASMGERQLPFARELVIERDDFMEHPAAKFYRLAPGREVRLRYAYMVTCSGVERDSGGQISAVRCRYDPQTRGGATPDKRKVRGTIHWVSVAHALRTRVRLYDRLFCDPAPDPEKASSLNRQSLVNCNDAHLEPSLRDALPGQSFQFERSGYFIADPVDSVAGQPRFNRSVTLHDSFRKQVRGG